MSHEVDWKPGAVGRIRGLVRSALLAVLGDGGERRLHGWYHRVLRATGRFGLPEDKVTTATLAAIAARSSTIIDIGANVGIYAWFLRRHAGPHANLFALEPHPGASALLRDALGGLAGCTVLDVAASDRDGTATLVVPDGAFGSPVSGLAWVEADAAPAQPDHLLVRVRRLDGLIEDGSVTVVGPVFVKIDVEGGEGRVLGGAIDLLRNHRPIVYFECQASSLARQGETPESVWAIFREARYRIFANQSGRFQPVTAVVASIVNYLAIPDDQAAGSFDEMSIGPLLDAWAGATLS